MPEAAKALGFGFRFDDFSDVGMVIDTIGKHVFLERTKSTGKITILIWRQLLVTKVDYLVVEKRLIDRFDLRIGKLGGQIDTPDFSAQRTGLRNGFHGVIVWLGVEKKTRYGLKSSYHSIR